MTAEEQAMWQEMADLTLSKCKQHCRKLGSCCDHMYCESAIDFAKKQGVEIKRDFGQPLLIKDGKCKVPAHLRPMCTMHQCKISSIGCDPKDPEWTEKYFKLREKLDLTL